MNNLKIFKSFFNFLTPFLDFFEFSGGSGSGCTRLAHFLITLENKVNELRKGSSYFEGAKLKKSEIQDSARD